MRARVAVHFIGVGLLFLAAVDLGLGPFSPIAENIDLSVLAFGLGLVHLGRAH